MPHRLLSWQHSCSGGLKHMFSPVFRNIFSHLFDLFSSSTRVSYFSCTCCGIFAENTWWVWFSHSWNGGEEIWFGVSPLKADPGSGSSVQGPGSGSGSGGRNLSCSCSSDSNLTDSVVLGWVECSFGVFQNLQGREGWVLMTEHRLKERERTVKRHWKRHRGKQTELVSECSLLFLEVTDRRGCDLNPSTSLCVRAWVHTASLCIGKENIAHIA